MWLSPRPPLCFKPDELRGMPMTQSPHAHFPVPRSPGPHRVRRLDRLEGGQRASLDQAQALIAQMRSRDLYRYINEVMVPSEWLKDGRWEVRACPGAIPTPHPTLHALGRLGLTHCDGRRSLSPSTIR